MQRRADWPERLAAYVQACARAPFAWGRHALDCVSFGAGAVRAQTDVDLLADAPDWHDEASALAALRQVGGLRRAVGARLPQIAPAQARRGDVGLARIDRRIAGIAVIIDDGILAPGLTGLVRVPRALLLHAWQVG